MTPPEYVLDGVRGWLIFSEGPRDMKNLRFFVRRDPRCHESDVPSEWNALPDEAHVTKAMLAEVLYRAFRRAEGELRGAQEERHGI